MNNSSWQYVSHEPVYIRKTFFMNCGIRNIMKRMQIHNTYIIFVLGSMGIERRTINNEHKYISHEIQCEPLTGETTHTAINRNTMSK